MTIILLTFLASFFSQAPTADAIIQKSIKAHGGKNYQKKAFAFDFRDKHYSYENKKGQYRYTRSFSSTEGDVLDVLTNDGFTRTINVKTVTLAPEKAKAYSNSVNSVIYFAMLPYFLNDPAVHAELLGETQIKGQNYYKIRVTFSQDGGGTDHDDIYVYWIHTDSYQVDYLGYSYHVNGGGVRFRSAYNKRKVDGVLFQDYINYKHDKSTPVTSLDELYERGGLQELSRIELKNIESF